MNSALAFGISFVSLGFIEVITIFITASYVYLIEIKRIDCSWCYSYWTCRYRRRNLSNKGNIHHRSNPNVAVQSPSPSGISLKDPNDVSFLRLQRRLVLMVLISSFFASICCSGVAALHIISAFNLQNIDDFFCESVIPKLYSIAYVFSNTALYQFLNARSEVVKTSADKSINFRRLRSFTRFLACCTPIIAVLCFFYWNGRVVELDGKRYCIDSPSWELSLCFLFVSLSVSLTYLLLFLWPLRAFYQQMKHFHLDGSELLLYIIKRNLFLSMIAVSSTSLSMLFFVVTTTTRARSPTIYVYGVTLGVIDLCINNLCMSLMSNAWIPYKLKGICLFKSDPPNRLATNPVSPTLSDERSALNQRYSPETITRINAQQGLISEIQPTPSEYHVQCS